MSAPAPSPAGTPTQSWLEKWSEWEIQAVVLVSFGLQVILFFFAGIRRYNISSVLKVFLWLAYLTADAAAIYALGHMSASLSRTSTDKHQLVAFWAPFFLLHLGGQDTITAYALEDNKLWLRHLLNMFLQVAVTGYVLHKYIIADRATIVSAAVLIAVAGFVKYGERIWALKSASKVSYGPHLPRAPAPSKYEGKNCFTKNEKFAAYELILMTAHANLNDVVKPLIVFRDEKSTRWSKFVISPITEYVDRLLDQEYVSTREQRYADEVYRLIEVQLALYYDTLFTKAQVIHTWYGHLIHGISFASCFSALVAFTRSKRDRYSTPDTVISFVLLGGACVLEVASAFKAIGSTWTQALLRSYGWDRLARPILFARYHLVLVKDGRWSNSVGQYDFMSYCASDKAKLKGRMVRYCFHKFGFEDWWNKAHYTKHVKLSPALKKIVWGLLRGEKSGMVQIEDVAVQRGYWAHRLTGFSQSEQLDWSLRMEFHNCVYIWHIATSTFLSNPDFKYMLSDSTARGMAEAVNTLSDYMMYLLVQLPDILPMNAVAHSLFEKTHECFLMFWNRTGMNHQIPDEPQEIILNFMELQVQCDNFSWTTRKSTKLYQDDVISGRRDGEPGEAVLAKASILVRALLSMKLEFTHKLIIIGRVWAEMLCYAATTASGDFHARQLSNGGEFLTHILLLAKYCSGMLPTVQSRYIPTVQARYIPTRYRSNFELTLNHDSEEEITEVR